MDEQAYQAATTAFDRQDYLGALSLLHGILDEHTGTEALALLGETLARLGLPGEAADAFEQAAGKAGENAPRLLRRAALLLFQAGETDRAQLLGMRLLPLLPGDADIAFMLITLFLKDGEIGLVDALKNTLVDSDNPAHLALAEELIAHDSRNPASLRLLSKMALLYPDDMARRFSYIARARDFCDFEALVEQEGILKQALAASPDARQAETGYSNLLHCDDESLNRLAINNSLSTPTIQTTRDATSHRWAEKCRIGYVSSDFWDDHATMRLFQSVLEAHDRTRFDVTLFCYTPERFVAFDNDRRRHWGPIVSVAGMSDAQAAETIRKAGIDILVDLKGHTAGSRSGILNHRPAPVQVAWLGFPGSTVQVACDYVVGDPIVLPDSSKPFYHEKFCRLPECYQPNDPVHRALPPAPTRAALGLPEDRIVLAAFNAPRKISLPTIDLWVRILAGAPQTVLWMMVDDDMARANCLTYFAKRGIASERIIFARKTRYDLHIARLAAADFGLDTFPYNGHTTTSDTLWAGLPVLTKRGSNFASRVSQSLLTALGLPELILEDHDAYVAAAVELAADKEGISRLKARIAAQRCTAPLFDAERFCRHLERGFETIAQRARAGLAPEHIDIPALAPRSTPFSMRSQAL